MKIFQMFKILGWALVILGLSFWGLTDPWWQTTGASSKAQGRVWTVCSYGCDFYNIQDAIDAASSGDRIQIMEPGTYYEQLYVEGKDLELYGATPGLESPEQYVLDGGGKPGPIIHVKRGRLKIVGIKLQNGRPGVMIEDGSMTFEWCGLRKNKGAGVWDVGNVNLEFRQCPISGTVKASLFLHGVPHFLSDEDPRNGSAIIAEPDSQGRGYDLRLIIEESVIEDNEGFGLWVLGREAHIERSLIRNNNEGGIQLGFNESDVERYRAVWSEYPPPWWDVFLSDPSRFFFEIVELRDNEIIDNGGWGLRVRSERIIDEGNEIHGNIDGDSDIVTVVPPPPPCQEPPCVCIAITAEVEYVDDYDNILAGAVKEGDIITGRYIYDLTTPDTNPLPTVGDYWHETAPFGISLNVGGLRFRTDPNNVNFLVEIINDKVAMTLEGPKTFDSYLLISYNNIFDISAPSEAPFETENLIAWYLKDPTATALSSTALPTEPPDLAKWQSIFGLNIESHGHGLRDGMFHIRAHVTSAELCGPEPSASDREL